MLINNTLYVPHFMSLSLLKAFDSLSLSLYFSVSVSVCCLSVSLSLESLTHLLIVSNPIQNVYGTL